MVLQAAGLPSTSPRAGLGQVLPESQLPGWGAASAAGSWRKQDPGANGRQSLALDETLDPGSGLGRRG